MASVALTIAGSDPSGGAGIQADLKTFHQFGVYGAAALTLLTVQNTRGVETVHVLDAGLVAAQIDAVVTDIPPTAAKTGALGAAGIIEVVARCASEFGFPLIVDPVMISKHGHRLLPVDAVTVLRRRLIPLAWLVTPNIHEAAALAEMEIRDQAAMETAAARLGLLGARHVLIKGAALDDPPDAVVDVLWTEGDLHRFAAPRIRTSSVHGSGCVFAAAITALVARGAALECAVAEAKSFVTEAIRTHPELGGGCGPLNLHAPVPSGG